MVAYVASDICRYHVVFYNNRTVLFGLETGGVRLGWGVGAAATVCTAARRVPYGGTINSIVKAL